MKILCAFRPGDPGAASRETPDYVPSLTGWVYTEITRQQANYMLDWHTRFEKFKSNNSNLTNMAVGVPNPMTVHLMDPHEDLEQLWRDHRHEDSKLAILPDDTTSESLPGTRRDLQQAEIDLTIEPKGVWYQIFLPDIQFTVETAILDRELLQDAAGMPTNSD